MNNNFTNLDICMDRIKVLYINKSNINENDITSIKKEVEKKLQHLSEQLYNNFYDQKFIYEVTGESNNNIEVTLIKNQDITQLTDKMFIVNN